MDAMHTNNHADTTTLMDKDNFINNGAKVYNRMYNYALHKKRFNWKQSEVARSRTEEKSSLEWSVCVWGGGEVEVMKVEGEVYA